MQSQSQENGGFAKVIIRDGSEHITQTARGLATKASEILLEKRASVLSTSTSKSTSPLTDPNKDASGLSPLEVILFLAVMAGIFLVLLIIGEICKVFNKPKKEAAPYLQQKLFQPSAAGYGTRSAMSSLQVPRMGKGGAGAQASRVSLLHHAMPMGRGGKADDETIDTSFETPSSSSHSGGGNQDGGSRNGHTRGQSSGVQMPGTATMAMARKGAGMHPMVNGQMNNYPPDGSGFKPGQPVNFSGVGLGPAPVPASSSKPIPAHARTGLGKPPASDATRRSRYSRAMSKGPAQLRKSMYLGADDDPMNPDLYGGPGGGAGAGAGGGGAGGEDRKSRVIRRPSNTNRPSNEAEGGGAQGLRRIDSMGKGDARRKSQIQTLNRASRAISVYNPKNADKAVLLSAQADNFGAGRSNMDPLGASPTATTNGSYLMPANGQNPRSRSGSGSSGGGGSSIGGGMSVGSRTPNSSNEPLFQPALSRQQSHESNQAYARPSYPMMNGTGFAPGAIMPSGMGQPQQQQQQQSIPAAYPGGGAPRIRRPQGGGGYPSVNGGNGGGVGGQAIQAAGGYDRSGRQIL